MEEMMMIMEINYAIRDDEFMLKERKNRDG